MTLRSLIEANRLGKGKGMYIFLRKRKNMTVFTKVMAMQFR